jgi:hypothetical protein
MGASDDAETGCAFGDSHLVLPRRQGVEVFALYARAEP